MQYRPDIDGLRTIAVMSVVAYHAGFSAIPGGFLGVDVFFVISGFLIFSIIRKEIEAGSFSIVRFYDRRARRILPALFLVMLAIVPFAWWQLSPKALEELGGSGVAALFFGSNIWFWLEDSYWAEDSLLKPLLHTWSLAVEEQYYIFAPLLLVFISRLRNVAAFVILSAALLASLAWAQAQSQIDPTGNFYLIPTRAWELLAGGILAVMGGAGRRYTQRRLATETTAVIALLLLLVPMFVMEEDWPHPSIFTVPAVAGTAALIQFGARSKIVSILLANRPMVAIGLLSYSIYLWHMPVFAFARIMGDVSAVSVRVALIALSIALAGVGYFAVERPFRDRSAVRNRVFYPLLAAAFAALVVLYGAFFWTGGAPWRLGTVNAAFERLKHQPLDFEQASCTGAGPDRICTFNGRGRGGKLVLVGDSHAGVLAPSLLKVAERRGMQFVPIIANGCILVHGTTSDAFDTRKAAVCRQRAERLRTYLAQSSPTTVVYAGQVVPQFTGLCFGLKGAFPCPGGDRRLKLDPLVLTDAEDALDALRLMFSEWRGNGHRLVVVGQVPPAGVHVPNEVIRRLQQHPRSERGEAFDAMEMTTPAPLVRAYVGIGTEIYRAAAGDAMLVRPVDMLCGEDRCNLRDEADLFYGDNNHLSPVAAQKLADMIEQRAFAD